MDPRGSLVRLSSVICELQANQQLHLKGRGVYTFLKFSDKFKGTHVHKRTHACTLTNTLYFFKSVFKKRLILISPSGKLG